MPKQATSDDVCHQLKRFGYFKQYGEDFEVISEPFADGNRFVVRVRSGTQKSERLLRIPKSIVEAAKHIAGG